MGLGMLNAAALNRVALNAAASTVLVLASAAFTAEATVTAAPVHTQAAEASILAGLEGTFNQTLFLLPSVDFSAGAALVLAANTSHAGVGGWTNSSTFQPVVYRTVQASADFEPTASFEGIADSQIATGTWVANATFAPVSIKSGALSGVISGGSSFAADDDYLIKTRLADAAWVAGSTLWVEGDITTGGVTTFDGHLVLTPTITLDIPNHLMATFINGAFIGSGASWIGEPTLFHGASGLWPVTAELSMEPTKTVEGTLAIEGGALFTAEPSLNQLAGVIPLGPTITVTLVGTVIQKAFCNLEAGPDMSVVPSRTAAGRTNWINSTSLVLEAVKKRPGVAPLSGSISLTANAVANYTATASWAGVVSSVGGAAVVTLVPAPASRIFKISTTSRRFTVGGSPRTFEVSP